MALKVNKKIVLKDKAYVMLCCDKCGAGYTVVDDNIDKTECSVCNNKRYYMQDLSADEQTYRKNLNKHHDNDEYGLLGTEYNDTFNEQYWNIIGYFGIHRDSSTFRPNLKRRICSCKRCGFIKIMDMGAEYNTVCNCCRWSLADEELRKATYEWCKLEKSVRLQRELEARARKAEEENEKVQKSVAANNEAVAKMQVESMVSKREEAKTRVNSKFSETRSPYRVIEAYEQENIERMKIACKACGRIEDVVAIGWKDAKNYKCKGCLIKAEKDINYAGVLKRSIVGTVINNIRCIRDDIDIDSSNRDIGYECTGCGKKANVKKINFLLGRITCSCSRNTVYAECSSCGAASEVSIADIMKSTDFTYTCNKCGNIHSNSSLRALVASSDKLAEKRVLLTDTLKKLPGGEVSFRESDLAARKKPLYCDEDGNFYYNCWCLKHKQRLILNDKEIDGYEHDKCNSTLEMFISERKLAGVRLNREAIENESDSSKNKRRGIK